MINKIKKLSKFAGFGVGVLNNFMPSGVLQVAVLQGLKVLVNRNNNEIDNVVLKAYIKKSNLSDKDKQTLLQNL